MLRVFASVLCMMVGLPAALAAEPFALVTAVQPPVWITHRGEEPNALSATQHLASGDAVITGPGARAQIALADGSLLRLAENTTVLFSQLQLKSQKPLDTLEGQLKLSTGSARFSSAATSTTMRHDLTFTLARGLTTRVQNGDLWMSATGSEDRVMQISGQSVVTPRKHTAMTLSQPYAVLTDLRQPEDDALPFRIALSKDPKSLTAGTDLIGTLPSLQSTGFYRVALAAYADGETAEERVRRYRALGYPVDLQKPSEAPRPAFRVILDGLATEKDAQQYAALLIERLKILNPQVEALAGIAP